MRNTIIIFTDVGKVLKVVFGLHDTGDSFPIIAEEILVSN